MGRTSIRVLVLLTISVFALSIPELATPSIIDPMDEPGKLSFFSAPAQVQRDILTTFAECGTPVDIVKSTALVEAGPYGGPGRRDFMFAFTQDDWPRKWNSADYPLDGRCAGNYTWFILWMHSSGQQYKELILVGDSLVLHNKRYLLFDVGCGEMPWWSHGRFTIWDAKRESFVPISNCMKTDNSAAWLKAHGHK